MPTQYEQVHSEEDLSAVCRLCVTRVDPSDLLQIFSDSLGTLEKRIKQVLQIQVCNGDGLPAAVCNECVENLNNTFRFFAESAATDDFLRKVVAVISENIRPDENVLSGNDKFLMITEAMRVNSDMSSLCRLCGTKQNLSDMTAIFGHENQSMETPIRSLLHLVLSEGDGLPDSLCSKCVDKLNAAEHFVTEAVAGDDLLRNVLYKGTEVEEFVKLEPKLEPDDLGCDGTLEIDVADLSDMVDPLAMPWKDEEPIELLMSLQQVEKPAGLQDSAQQDEKFTQRQQTCEAGMPFAADPLMCVSCITKFPTKASLITHCCSKFSKKSLEQNEPFIKLVRLEEAISTQRLSSLMGVHLKNKPVVLTEPKDWLQQVKKPSDLQSTCVPNVPFSVKPCTCASYTVEFSTNIAIKPHVCGAICRKSLELNQPILELVRLEDTITFSARRLSPHAQVHIAKQPFSCGISSPKTTLITKKISEDCATVMTNTCDFHKKKCHREDYLVIHTKQIHAKPYSCKFCTRTFSRLDHQMNHTCDHTKPSNICEICKKVFKRKYTLTLHMQSHTRELSNSFTVGPRATFACCFCRNMYHNRRSMRRHIMAVHSAISYEYRPYTCAVCDKVFANKKNLVRHSHLHASGTTFACGLCRKQIGISSLKQHLLTHLI